MINIIILLITCAVYTYSLLHGFKGISKLANICIYMFFGLIAFIMVVVLLTMIAFYATSFDSIALTASCYSYHTLEDGEQPNKGIQLMWCILLILLPIALLFAESSMNNLQSVSIVAAFPIGAVIVMIAVSFMKDAKKYMESLDEKKQKEVDNVSNGK